MVDKREYIIKEKEKKKGQPKGDEVERTLQPVRFDTTGLGAPTALSMSDKGFLLVAFSCGSICIYENSEEIMENMRQKKRIDDKDGVEKKHNFYTIPLTVWYHTTEYPLS